MHPRHLGTSGLSTAPLVLGGNTFGWTADAATSFAILDAFVDGGGTMIDTADIYSAWIPGNQGGESETIIGDWLAESGRRDDVTIATKVGMKRGADGMQTDLSPAYIAAAVEQSLRRLRIDRIDLLFAHRDDPATPLPETMQALDRLVQDGKVRALGASNYEADRLADANRDAATGFTVLQPEYNLLERDFETALQGFCVANIIGVTPYYGLASGFLTGKYRAATQAAGRARSAATAKYCTDRGWHMLATMDAVAAETEATLPQIALAWLAAQSAVTAPIASATSVAQVEELLGAMSLVLSPGQLARLTQAGAVGG